MLLLLLCWNNKLCAGNETVTWARLTVFSPRCAIARSITGKSLASESSASRSASARTNNRITSTHPPVVHLASLSESKRISEVSTLILRKRRGTRVSPAFIYTSLSPRSRARGRNGIIARSVVRFSCDISTRIYARPVIRIISGEHEARLERECTFRFIFIIITAAVSARARPPERASERARGICIRSVYRRHPVSCLSCFRFSRVRARGLEIQHVTGKRFADASLLLVARCRRIEVSDRGGVWGSLAEW